MYFIVDESGDLRNWNLQSMGYSKYFSLAGIVLENKYQKKKLARKVQECLSKLNLNRSYDYQLSELKFSKTGQVVLKNLLNSHFSDA